MRSYDASEEVTPVNPLRLLLVKLRSLRVSPSHGYAMTSDRSSEPKRFRQDELERNPSVVMRHADIDGSVVITDDDGRPRMRIGAPFKRPLVID